MCQCFFAVLNNPLTVFHILFIIWAKRDRAYCSTPGCVLFFRCFDSAELLIQVQQIFLGKLGVHRATVHPDRAACRTIDSLHSHGVVMGRIGADIRIFCINNSDRQC